MEASTLETARRNMVEYQIRCCKVLDSELLDMLESMPREDYLPENVRSLAYMEGRIPLPCNQETLSPLQEATILQTLGLQGHERVLEIGTGTGYLTTLLAMRAGEVTSCELHDELASLALKNIESHGIDNAKTIQINAMNADSVKNSKELSGSFDVIVIGMTLKEVPQHLKNLLSADGQIIAFIGKNPIVKLVHMRHLGHAYTRTEIFETLLQDAEAIPEKREFVF
ncbi:MAG: methyltransferase domain-containing protein [Mariprofundaceae bacterium]